jgi:hypothetical protein
MPPDDREWNCPGPLTTLAGKVETFFEQYDIYLKEVGVRNVWFAFISAALACGESRFVSQCCRCLAMRCKLMVTEKGPDGEPLPPTEKVCCVRGIPDGFLYDKVDDKITVVALVECKAMSVSSCKVHLPQIFLQLEAINSHLDDGQRPIPGEWLGSLE